MSWLERNWYACGLVAAVCLLLLVPLLFHSATTSLAIVYLQLPLYMLHQVEEHRGDAFRSFFNRRLGGGRELLTPRAVLVINLVGVWLVDLAALCLAAFVDVAWGLIAVYLAIVNGVLHAIAAVAFRQYNPGLVTGLVLFLGVGGWSLFTLASRSGAGPSVHVIALAVAIVEHIAIIVHVRRRRAGLDRLPPRRDRRTRARG